MATLPLVLLLKLYGVLDGCGPTNPYKNNPKGEIELLRRCRTMKSKICHMTTTYVDPRYVT